MAGAVLALGLLALQPPGDTIPLPSIDPGWGGPAPVTVDSAGSLSEVDVWIHVDAWGRVRSAHVEASALLPKSARVLVERAARDLRFVRAADARSGWTRVVVPLKERPVREWAPGADPSFTPYEMKPRVKDLKKAVRLMEERYPRNLRNAGYGGTAIFWAFIDETGKLDDVRLHRTSGHPVLDEAAESVLWELEFEPARHKGSPVPVWIQQPMMYSVRRGRGDVPEQFRRPVRFELGSAAYPVVEATTTSPFFYSDTTVIPGGVLRPELVEPNALEDELRILFQEMSPGRALGVDLEMVIDVEGRASDLRVEAVHPEKDVAREFVAELVRRVSTWRFRPALVSGLQKPVPVTARFVFLPDLGPAPSVPAVNCEVDSALAARPQVGFVDTAAVLATPAWERTRMIAETWPFSLMRKGKRHEFRLWVLVDRRGHVCGVESIEAKKDRYAQAKAREIARRLRYTPARRDGMAVDAWRQEALVFSF